MVTCLVCPILHALSLACGERWQYESGGGAKEDIQASPFMR